MITLLVATLVWLCLWVYVTVGKEISIIASALDKMAEAVCNEHDWKVEDRARQTIDDIEPCRCLFHADAEREKERNHV